MDLPEFVAEILRGAIAPVAAPTEKEYFATWLDYDMRTLDPFMTAALGGALADRLAWVFVAGYQGTIRRCFPDLPTERGWSSFVNTFVAPEDPSAAIPAATLTGAPGHRRLSGWKTWVAACDHVERLLVSARQGETPFIVLRRDRPGVRIETSPAKGFLSEMSQGRVEFIDVAVGEDDLTGDERTFPAFRSAESAYVRAALYAFLFSQCCRLGAPLELISSALAGLGSVASALRMPLPSDTAAVAMLGCDLHTRLLAPEFETFIEQADPDLHRLWMKDRRLVTGAASGIAQRAEAALRGVARSREAKVE